MLKALCKKDSFEIHPEVERRHARRGSPISRLALQRNWRHDDHTSYDSNLKARLTLQIQQIKKNTKWRRDED
jgi:hypothetical protein